MFNLLGEMPDHGGESSNQYPATGVYWHDYHKTARQGRKIGHVTVTAQSDTGLRARSSQLAAYLGVAAELNLESVL